MVGFALINDRVWLRKACEQMYEAERGSRKLLS